MKQLDSILTKVENVLAAGSLGAAALMAIIAVVLRTFFNQVIFWSEETIIYLVIFSTFLGAVVTLRHNEHVNVDVIAAFLGERGKRVMALLGAVVTLVYLGAVGVYAWVLIFEPVSSMTTTPALHLPLWVVTLPLPIGFTLMFLRTLQVIVRLATGREGYPHAESSLLAAEGGVPLADEDLRRDGDDGKGDAR